MVHIIVYSIVIICMKISYITTYNYCGVIVHAYSYIAMYVEHPVHGWGHQNQQCRKLNTCMLTNNKRFARIFIAKCFNI